MSVDARPLVRGLDERQKRLVMASWWIFLVKEAMSVDVPAEALVRGMAVGLMKLFEEHMSAEALHRCALARGRYWMERDTGEDK